MTPPPALPRPPALELDGLTKSYDGVPALAGVSLRLEPGEVLGYVGSNGAGKTTTMKLVAGLLRPSAGRAAVCGFDVVREPLEAKARTGYVPESGAVFEKLTPREYLTSIGRLYRLERPALEEAIGRWLERFDLTARADRPLASLSKGMRQKTNWCAALLHDPELLLLDEPLNGLDVESVSTVKELLPALAAAGRAVLYSSHIVDVVEKVCTRLVVLQAGRVIAGGSAGEVRARAGGASDLEEALLRLWRGDPSAPAPPA